MVDSHSTLFPTESWHCAASTEWLKITLFLLLDMLSVASLFLLPICIHMPGLMCACGLPLSFLMNTAILVHEGVCVCACVYVLACMRVRLHVMQCSVMLPLTPLPHCR